MEEINSIIIVGFGNLGKSLTKGLKNKHRLTLVVKEPKNYISFENEIKQEVKIIKSKKINIENKIVFLCIPNESLSEISKEFIGEAKSIISTLSKKSIKEIKSQLNNPYLKERDF